MTPLRFNAHFDFVVVNGEVAVIDTLKIPWMAKLGEIRKLVPC